MNTLRVVYAFFIITLVSGCVSIPSPDETAPALQLSANEVVAIGVVDNRPYVLNGDKEPYFAGVSRSPFGMVISMPTYGKQSMSDLLLERIKFGFNKQKIKTVELKNLSVQESKNISTLVQKGGSADRILLIVLNEWKSDRHPNTYAVGFAYSVDFLYDVDVKVMDKNGQQIVSQHFQGKETEESEQMNPHKQDHFKYKAKLEQMINDAKVSKALQG